MPRPRLSSILNQLLTVGYACQRALMFRMMWKLIFWVKFLHRKQIHVLSP